MRSPQNSSQRWNGIWRNAIFRIPWTDTLETFYRKKVYFSAMENLLGPYSLVDKDILELGSGTGNNSLYLAGCYGARSVTLVDFSEEALARVVAGRYLCPVSTIQKDLFEFRPPRLYNFVHSTGLVEHFGGEERFAVVRKHAECLVSGGLAMIWVPVHSPVFSFIGQFNRWMGIDEIPFTEEELRALCAQSGLEIIRENHSAFGALYGILARKA